MFFDWDWRTAATHLARGVELNPSSAEGHLFYAWYLMFRGDMDRAVTEVTRAHELDKLSPVIATRHGNILAYTGRDAEAIQYLQEALRLDSTFLNAREELAYEFLLTGQRDSARRVVPINVVHTGSGEGAYPAMVLAQLGDSAGAREQLRRLQAAARERYVAADAIAGVYSVLGDSARALDFLERALEEHAFTLVFLMHYPQFDWLHGNPRFQRIVQRVGVIRR
jgi:Flp pilus assembly protein TadD